MPTEKKSATPRGRTPSDPPGQLRKPDDQTDQPGQGANPAPGRDAPSGDADRGPSGYEKDE